MEKLHQDPQNLPEKTEQELKQEIAKKLAFAKEKQRLFERIDKDKKLAYLKSLIERGLLRPETVERMLQ